MPASARQPHSQAPVPAAVPHYAKQAWKLTDHPPNRAGTRLNIANVVEAAVELADQDGLAELSIRHLAKKLGLTPMAVYRHVESRDELIVLMVDVVLGRPPTADPGPASWPDALLRWGTSLYQRYEAHPWLLAAPIPGMPSTPNLVHWMDRLLGDLEATNLPIVERLNIALLIAGHVRHIANIHLQVHPISPAEPPDAMWGWLPQFVTPEAFPFYARIFEKDALGQSQGPGLEYGLERIVDGIQAHCTTRQPDTSG